MTLTEEQRRLITSAVPLLSQHGKRVTKHLYETLFTEHPDLRNTFNHASQVNSHQPDGMAAALYAYASNINDLSRIMPIIEKVNHKHASLDVQPEYYAVMGQALIRSFRYVLGEALFNNDLCAAWSAAYNDLASLMSGREQAIRQDHEAVDGGWRGWRQMRIARKVRESDDISSFYLTPLDGERLPAFKPGQYVSVRVPVPNLGFLQTRQYSMADPSPVSKPRAQRHPTPHALPNDDSEQLDADDSQSDYYRIMVRNDPGNHSSNPGFVSGLLHRCAGEGDCLEMTHPTGRFYFDVENTPPLAPIVLISAGVGLTPLMSILQTLLQEHEEQPGPPSNAYSTITSHSSSATRTQGHVPLPPRRPITWIHSARNLVYDPFAADIHTLVRQNPNIRTRVHHSHPQVSEIEGVHYDFPGRVNLDVFTEQERRDLLHIDDEQTLYFMCGPDRFMLNLNGALEEMGVPQARVKTERFDLGSVRA